MDPTPHNEPSPGSCAECGSRLAHDQRYCVDCGARRGPLPRHISQVVGGIMERGQRVPAGATLETERELAERGRFDAWLVAPRAAAVAVMGMLGFGVVVGSLVSGSEASPLAPIIVALSPSSPHAASSALGTGSGGGGGSGGSITVTTTTPAPQTSTGAGSGSGGAAGSTTTNSTPSSTHLPPIKHVFMVVLSGEGYNQTFGHSGNDPYLAKTLVSHGELLVNYYGVAPSPLGNEIAMISGQGPNPESVNDCPTYDSFIASGAGDKGQELGSGCVYATTVQSLADQLTAAKLTWKAYLQTKGTQKRAGTEQCHPGANSSRGSASSSSKAIHDRASMRW